jgi:hypothetical protein
MIQIRRGKTASWQKNKTKLADGQPGYDRELYKLKIGDGKHLWDELPDASGLRADEILAEESEATKSTIFTYGTQPPTLTTKGEIYLQQFEGGAEADYVIEIGKNLNYFYRKWNSGFIECWGKGTIPESINNEFDTIIFSTQIGDYFEIKGFWK